MLGELVIVGIDVRPVLCTGKGETEGIVVDSHRIGFLCSGILPVHHIVIIACRKEFAYCLIALAVDESDGVVGVVPYPCACTNRNLPVEMVQVKSNASFRVGACREYAVPVLCIFTAIVDALACGIAVCSDFSEGEFQIVIILGLRTISVAIPAP